MMWEDTMGFDVSKVRDEARAMDPDVASIDRRIQDAAASMVGVNADRVRRLTGFSDTQGRRGIADVLAPTKPLMGLDSPFLRSAAGIPASGTLLGALQPGGIYGRIKPAFADDSLCKPVTKFGTLAVVENRASAALNASTVRSVAHSFRNLRPLEESTRRWPSMYNGVLGSAGFQQVSAMQQTLAGQYEGRLIQIKKFLEVQSANIGTQAVERFVRAHESQLRATLNACTSPLFDAIRKNPAGFDMWALQRMGEWIKRVARPLGGITDLDWTTVLYCRELLDFASQFRMLPSEVGKAIDDLSNVRNKICHATGPLVDEPRDAGKLSTTKRACMTILQSS
jgi:hypothetical protein